MPTSSGARRLMNLCLARLADAADPISSKERIGTTQQLHSLGKNTEMIPEHEIAHIPVRLLDYRPISSSLPRPLSPVVLETPGGES
jgi:hypothetical protein